MNSVGSNLLLLFHYVNLYFAELIFTNTAILTGNNNLKEFNIYFCICVILIILQTKTFVVCVLPFWRVKPSWRFVGY